MYYFSLFVVILAFYGLLYCAKMELQRNREMKIVHPDSRMLKNGNAGDIFISFGDDKNLTAKANYFKRKIKTQRAVLLTFDGLMNPHAISVTKVIIEQ